MPQSSDPITALGNALLGYRLSRGLSVRAMAARLHMQGHGGLTDYEKGRRLPPEDLIIRYEQVLRIPDGQLRRLRARALAARADRRVKAHRVIAELPPVPPDFQGRAAELEAMSGPRDIPEVVVLSGPPGVGKTTLALKAAHSATADTWFYQELGGTETPAAPADVLHRFLRTLGVADAEIPPDLPERTALYRSLLKGRTPVLLLDDAANEAQIRPLVPGAGPALVLVTSRRRLGGLAGARRLTIDVPPREEALALFAEIVGERAEAEPEAARKVIELCGGLPLAVRIAGARLAAWPGWTVEYLAGLLDDERRRLSQLTSGDVAVRSVFEVAYRDLPERARKLFRRLSLVPAPDLGHETAAVLLEGADAIELLDELAGAGVLSAAPAPGRYRFHDLLRLYARERFTAEEPGSTVERSLCAWILSTARLASRTIADADAARAHPGGRQAALKWLDAEEPAIRGALRAAVRGAADAPDPELLDDLAWYYDLRCRWPEQEELARLALELADRTGDPILRAVGHNIFGGALSEVGRGREAVEHHRAALAAARLAGNWYHEAGAHQKTGVALWDLGDYAGAVEAHTADVAINEEHGTRDQVASARSRLGQSLRLAGRHAEARDLLVAVLATMEAVGNGRSAAMAAVRLAGLANDTGRHTEALAHATRARELFAGTDDAWGVGVSHLESGRAHQGLGRTLAATAEATAAVAALAGAPELRQAKRLLEELSGERP